MNQILLLAGLGAAAVVAALAIVSWWRYRGTRVITCPENLRPAGVEVNALRLAVSSTLGLPGLRLSDCTRWPEKRGCGQECLRQVEEAPHDCLVRTMVARWYRGKVCVICRRLLDERELWQHKPCLMSPARETMEWSQVPPETLPAVLETHKPVCWNCHIAETFRRKFADLVIDR
jgi:hypothetical protein